MKVLNLYAGIGGNRKLWPKEAEVTAVEYDGKIAQIYERLWPKDRIIIGDAHKYLLEHYKEFDFIWASPPCPTHSQMRNLCNVQEGKKTPYPDMRLYQEIIFLKHWFKGIWVVENVIPYYEPLIKPYISGNHCFWSNFYISNFKKVKRGIRSKDLDTKAKERGFCITEELPIRFKEKILNNCVMPELGLHIWNCAFKEKQVILTDVNKEPQND